MMADLVLTIIVGFVALPACLAIVMVILGVEFPRLNEPQKETRYITDPQRKKLTSLEAIELLDKAEDEEQLEKIKAEITKRGVE